MKAEHRKELQTNLLADRMGRVLQNVKGRPSRRGVLLVLLVLVLVVGGGIAYLVYTGRINDNAQRWKEFETTVDLETLQNTAKDYDKTQQGKAARAQIAWLRLWEFGIKRMGMNSSDGLKQISVAKDEFTQLADDCKDDPVLGAEALYGIAVCEETLACDPRDAQMTQLDKALKAYRRVTEEHEKSGFAAKARERVRQFENKEERERIESFYRHIQTDTGRLQMFHEQLNPLLEKQKKK